MKVKFFFLWRVTQLYNNRDKLGGSEQAEDPIEKMSTQGILDKLYEEIESKVGRVKEHRGGKGRKNDKEEGHVGPRSRWP